MKKFNFQYFNIIINFIVVINFYFYFFLFFLYQILIKNNMLFVSCNAILLNIDINLLHC